MNDPHDPEAMYERERQLREWIAESHQRHMRQYQDETAPWIEELTNIEACKPPKPFTLPDGRQMIYAGPRPRWTPHGLDMAEYDAADKAKQTKL